ncbi:MAG: type II toxin-antitoxin system HicA family toxin [Nitrospinae bacterium]|nr:type II toxin-antitoxin system HicA family toxin [Nitrospinota bacterium]
MPKSPALTSKEVIRILERNGFVFDHATGSHRVYYHQQNKRRAVVPFHKKDLPKGTLIAILKEAGIQREEWSK